MPDSLPSRTRELQLRAKGFLRIAGVDEAGVGPMAGPVVAGAVILPEAFDVEGIRDSKLIPEPERARLELRIQRQALAWGIGVGTVEEINAQGISPATDLAMRRAVDSLAVRPDFLLIDARKLDFGLPREHPTKGDRDHTCIAAASILAKQHRDRLMLELHEKHPHYRFDSHKGYPAPAHLLALAMHGVSPVHRVSWLAVREAAGLLSPLYYDWLPRVRAAKTAPAIAQLRNELKPLHGRLPDEEFERLRELLRRKRP